MKGKGYRITGWRRSGIYECFIIQTNRELRGVISSRHGQYPAAGFQLRFKFDAPGKPHVTDLEGISGGGDSGGPAYIKRDGVLYVIGVSSGQDRRHLKVGRYGVFEYYVRVSHFAGWIRSVVGN